MKLTTVFHANNNKMKFDTFRDELKAKEGDRQGVDAMKVEEQNEFEQLLQKNEQRNKKLVRKAHFHFNE